MGTRDIVRRGLVEALACYDSLVEVGVGERPGVAAALAERGCDVTTTDVHERSLPAAVAFVRDDVTEQDPSTYRDADVVYALNCPPELQGALVAVADAVDADCAFTTLGADPVVVPARQESVAGTRKTLHWARES